MNNELEEVGHTVDRVADEADLVMLCCLAQLAERGVVWLLVERTPSMRARLVAGGCTPCGMHIRALTTGGEAPLSSIDPRGGRWPGPPLSSPGGTEVILEVHCYPAREHRSAAANRRYHCR